jgi:competence protein ComEA
MELSPWWRSPRLLAAALCFALGTLILGAALLPQFIAPPAAPEAPLELFAEPDEPTEPDLVVYVTGAVAAPDVYRLPPGARVKDAVVAAGGLRSDAADAQVNLAEPLSDAQHVHVPAVSDAAPAASGASTGPTLIDINSASAAELEELPGIGATLSARIIARREAEGPFASVEELREVTGIGAKLFEQIAPLVQAGT